MTELRDYQQELLDQAADRLSPDNARVMLQLPTGGGKTHIAGALLRRRLHSGRKAAWLTHRTELADQTCRMLTDSGVSAISLKTWQPGNDAPSIPNGVVILMAQTVGRRTNSMEIWGSYRSADLLVIDEAHHATAGGWERAIRQWPGRVIGLTATPWRLSKTEGFDHLFGELICGPLISELQAGGWLCQARVHIPQPQDVIRGGAIATAGDYSESGIQQANSDHPDIMTAGALRFWHSHAAERSTIIYAISQDHARNLAAVFNDAGIPAAVVLSDTPPPERARAIESFGNGTLRALVNVAVATEGFDLPDASCVVITRPTMSLALYLQMVGRGLRPKPDGKHRDCLILDLAGNSEIHGLPQETRQWSLQPRRNNPGGDAPVIRCEECDGVSPAASHFCIVCQNPFGKDCPRCGAWQSRKRWSYETHCGQLHELVCDLCHLDAHIKAQLPVTDELRRLIDMDPELDAVLRNLLEDERRRAGGADEARKGELLSLIADRESDLANDSLLQTFKNHIAALPEASRPKSELEEYRLFPEWENSLRQDLAVWKDELGGLESRDPDRRLIYNNARERVLRVLDAQAWQTGLFPQTPPQREVPVRRPVAQNSNPAPTDITGWMSFVKLDEWGKNVPSKGIPAKPKGFRDSSGNETSVKNWVDLLIITAEWLINKGEITGAKCPVKIEFMKSRYLVHTTPNHSNGQRFITPKQLTSGLHLESDWPSKDIVRICGPLLAEFGEDPAQFHVLLD